MLAKRLASGTISYYWNPPQRDIKAGFRLHREALGSDRRAAEARADELNRHLDDWRAGRGEVKDLDLQPRAGTLDWLVERYFRSRAFTKVSERVQPDYRRELALLCDVPSKDGLRRAGNLPLAAVTARFVDRLYERLLVGVMPRCTACGVLQPGGDRVSKKARLAQTKGEPPPEGTEPAACRRCGGELEPVRRVRQANICLWRAAHAWDVVRVLYPETVPAMNPFPQVVRYSERTAPKAYCTREEAYALADALTTLGHPHLAIVPLVCFEWLQRPENVLAGHLAWTGWRPADHPNAVHIFHHKTGARVWYPLEDADGPLCPEIEARLAALKRLGVAIVLTPGEDHGGRGKPRPYSHFYARALVRKARGRAGLPAHVTLDACRHGGMTEIGDAEMTETDEMSLSGHSTPQVKRRYIKRTEAQRLRAARRRRAWVEERKEVGSQNAALIAESERASSNAT
jgi:hypothetical protein